MGVVIQLWPALTTHVPVGTVMMTTAVDNAAALGSDMALCKCPVLKVVGKVLCS